MTEWGEATCCLQINCWASSKESCQDLELGFLWPLVGLTPIPQELRRKGSLHLNSKLWTEAA